MNMHFQRKMPLKQIMALTTINHKTAFPLFIQIFLIVSLKRHEQPVPSLYKNDDFFKGIFSMKLGLMYTLCCIFAVLGTSGLFVGLYRTDGMICAIGILLIFATCLIFLEIRKERSNPFQKD